jgi:hypothetical protein
MLGGVAAQLVGGSGQKDGKGDLMSQLAGLATTAIGYVVTNFPKPQPRPPRVDTTVYTGNDVKPIKPYEPARPYTKGKVKGLFIGINYVGSSCELKGCVNDVKMILETLNKVKFPLQEACLLVEDSSFPGFSAMPTRQNIISHMQWLVKDAQPGDIFFFHYSGHGSETASEGDSNEKKDQVLCPMDYDSAGTIIDDDIFNLLVRDLPAGVRLTCLFDCCHSGSILDLPFSFVGSSGVQYNDDLTMKNVRQGNFSAGDVVMFSGCQDDQTSSDVGAHEGALAGGAATQALTMVLEHVSNLSLAKVILEMRSDLKTRGFTQVPQMTTSKPADLMKPFSLYGPIAVNEKMIETVPAKFRGANPLKKPSDANKEEKKQEREERKEQRQQEREERREEKQHEREERKEEKKQEREERKEEKKQHKSREAGEENPPKKGICCLA